MNGAAQAPVVVPLHAGTAASPVRRSLDLPDLIARAVIVTLFTMMTMRLGANFLETGRITGLLLVASELLVVVLTVARRRARTLDRTVRARLLTAMSMAGPPLVYPVVTGALAPETLTAGVSAVGLAIVIGGKVSLGRSFGLMPANRGIVSAGLYRLVRHPIYLGYLITHAAFLAAHPLPWNGALLVLADTALVLRAIHEERTLAADPSYQAYAARVRWRLVPGLY